MSSHPSPPDQAQRDRIRGELQTNLLVTAGAGSGKTSELVKRYLALLDSGLRPRSIAVVTFTRKAAAEMKTRVRDQLRERALGGGGQRDRQLAHEVEDAPIQTMDSFCARLLRSEALAAGLDPGFEVMDEGAAGPLLDEVVVGLLHDRFGRDDDAARQLHLVHDGYRDLVGLLRQALSRRKHWLNPLQSPPDEPLARHAFEYLRGERDDPPTALDYLATFRYQRIQAAESVAAGFPASPSGKLLRQALEASSEARPADDDKALPRYQTLCALQAAYHTEAPVEERTERLLAMAAANLSGGSAKVWGDGLQLLKDGVKLLREWLKEPRQRVLTPSPDGEESCAVATAALLPLLCEAQSRLAQVKRDRGLLAFDDLVLEVAKLLAPGGDPNVLQRLRSRFQRVLVDEYQDTDWLQDSLFRLLAGDRPGAFFAVGDDKQSIYGFRGAEVAVFTQAAEHQLGQAVPLSTTFRLAPRLAETLNQLFSDDVLMGRTPHDSPAAAVFRELQPFARPERLILDGPPVKFLLVDPGGSAAELIHAEAELLADDVQRMLQARPRLTEWRGELSPAPERELSYGDLAILLRTTTYAEFYRDALQARGIPVRTERGQLCRRQETLDLLALGRWLESPGDVYALTAVLRSPFGGLSDVELYRLAASAESLPEACEQSDWPALRRLARWRELPTAWPLTEVLRQAIEETGYRVVLAALPSPDRRLANLEAVLDELTRAEQQGLTGDAALAALEQRRDDTAEKDPEGNVYDADADAVSLLTIHGAKGLEWPVVYLADTARSMSGQDRTQLCARWLGTPLAAGRDEGGKLYLPAMIQPDLLPGAGPLSFEDERLLYVACTRARDRLVLSGAVSRKKDGKLVTAFETSALAALSAAAGLEVDALSTTAAVPGIEVGWPPLPEPLPPPDLSARVRLLQSLTPNDLPSAPAPLALAPPTPRLAVTRLAREVAARTPPEVELPAGLPNWTSPGTLGARLRGDWIHETLRAAGAARSEPTPEMVAVAGASLNVSVASDDPAFESVLRAARQGFGLAEVQQALGLEQVYIEEPFLLQHRGVLLEGRFDLVGVDSERVLLVDYKSGRPDARLYWEYVCETSLYALALSRRFVRHRLEVVMPLVDLNLCLPGPADFAGIAERALDQGSRHAAG